MNKIILVSFSLFRNQTILFAWRQQPVPTLIIYSNSHVTPCKLLCFNKKQKRCHKKNLFRKVSQKQQHKNRENLTFKAKLPEWVTDWWRKGKRASRCCKHLRVNNFQTRKLYFVEKFVGSSQFHLTSSSMHRTIT